MQRMNAFPVYQLRARLRQLVNIAEGVKFEGCQVACSAARPGWI